MGDEIAENLQFPPVVGTPSPPPVHNLRPVGSTPRWAGRHVTNACEGGG